MNLVFSEEQRMLVLRIVRPGVSGAAFQDSGLVRALF